MKVTTTIDEQTFIDVILTALEGGSNEWYWLDEIEFPEWVNPKLFFSEKVGQALYANKGWTVPVYDKEEWTYEDSGEALGILSYESCQKGFDLMSVDYPEELNRIITEQYDALDADIFFQLAVMGEIVYG